MFIHLNPENRFLPSLELLKWKQLGGTAWMGLAIGGKLM